MRVAAAALAIVLAAAPAVALEPRRPSDVAFVDAFRQVCVPERLSYERTKARALELGWTPVEDNHHPELATMLALGRAAMVDPDFPNWTSAIAAFTRDLEGRGPAFLVLTYLDDADIMTMNGCYLYDLEATEIVDPGLVTEFTRSQLAHSIDEDGLIGYIWGPPPKMPRTLDTQLSLLKEGSPHAANAGFTGMMLKFETSEPDPGEIVPKSYN